MIGTLIKFHREKRGLSQTKLARLLGTHHSYLSRLEDPETTRNVSFEMAINLANTFELTGGERLRFLAEAGYLEDPEQLIFDPLLLDLNKHLNTGAMSPIDRAAARRTLINLNQLLSKQWVADASQMVLDGFNTAEGLPETTS